MIKKETGRIIVHFLYTSKSTGKTYNSIILGLERVNGKYSLPGGQFDSRQDSDTLDAALRELEEELGLFAPKSSAKKVYTFNGNVCNQDIYVVNATGKLNIAKGELKGIGFFNAGKHNQIPSRKLERHVQALTKEYFGSKQERKTSSGIIIPGYYFTGNRDPKIKDWITQRDSF